MVGVTLYRPCKITGERAILRPSINASLEAAQSAWMDEKVRSRGRGAGGRKSERAGQDDDEGDAGGSETTGDSEIVAGTRACTYPPPLPIRVPAQVRVPVPVPVWLQFCAHGTQVIFKIRLGEIGRSFFFV